MSPDRSAARTRRASIMAAWRMGPSASSPKISGSTESTSKAAQTTIEAPSMRARVSGLAAAMPKIRRPASVLSAK